MGSTTVKKNSRTATSVGLIVLPVPDFSHEYVDASIPVMLDYVPLGELAVRRGSKGKQSMVTKDKLANY